MSLYLNKVTAFTKNLKNNFLNKLLFRKQISEPHKTHKAYRIILPSKKPALRIRTKKSCKAYRLIKEEKNIITSSSKRKEKLKYSKVFNNLPSLNNRVFKASISDLSNDLITSLGISLNDNEYFMFIDELQTFGKVDFLSNRNLENFLQTNNSAIYVEILHWQRGSFPVLKAILKPESGLYTHEGIGVTKQKMIESGLGNFLIQNEVQDFVYPCLKDRLDLTDRFVLSIDQIFSVCVDDALSVHKIGDNIYEIGIHIADVAAFLDINPEQDKYAREKISSVFILDHLYNLLPKNITELISLNTDSKKLAVSYITEVELLDGTCGKDFNVLKSYFARTLIEPKCKIAYTTNKQYNIHIKDKVKLETSLILLYKFCFFLRGKNSFLKKLDLIDVLLNRPLNKDFDFISILIRELMVLVSKEATRKILNAFPKRKLLGRFLRNKTQQWDPRRHKLRDSRASNNYSEVSSFYAAVTSPLRKYTNLVNQRLLLASMEKQKNGKYCPVKEKVLFGEQELVSTLSKYLQENVKLVDSKMKGGLIRRMIGYKLYTCKAIVVKIKRKSIIAKVETLLIQDKKFSDVLVEIRIRDGMKVYAKDSKTDLLKRFKAIWTNNKYVKIPELNLNKKIQLFDRIHVKISNKICKSEKIDYIIARLVINRGNQK